MNKHTPGPWDASCTEHGWVVADSSGNLIADIGQDDIESGDNCAQDARLIAAAPDLLAAARAAWNCMGELPPTKTRVEAAVMLSDAINKATGE